MIRKLFLLLVLVLYLMPKGVSQELRDLEAATTSGQSMLFDYRLHRNPAFIYRYLHHHDSTKKLHLVHLYRGSVIYNDQPDKKELPDQKGHYKLDFQLEPYYTSRFGDVDDPFRTQIGLGPLLQWNSRWGLYGIFQWLIPLQNDFKSIIGFGHRPGEVGIGYTKIFHQRSFINLFAGTFNNRRYGLSGEFIQMNQEGTIYYGGGIFYSGAYVFTDQTFIREVVDYVSGYLFFAYRFPKPDITLRLTGERYLFDDHGFKFEALRQFGNTDIGFYGQKSQNGVNGGIMVAFSLWPRKFYNNRWFQARLPHSFRFQYDLKSATTQTGRSVSNQTDFFYDILRFNPKYIENQEANPIR